jgi:putative alpha-1,2-mannosidase
MYFYAEFQESFTQYQTWSHGSLGQIATQAGDNLGFVSTQTNHAGGIQQVRIGISYISVEQAKHNLQAEIPGWDFDAIRKRARDIWNDALGKIDIGGVPTGSEPSSTQRFTVLSQE